MKVKISFKLAMIVSSRSDGKTTLLKNINLHRNYFSQLVLKYSFERFSYIWVKAQMS